MKVALFFSFIFNYPLLKIFFSFGTPIEERLNHRIYWGEKLSSLVHSCFVFRMYHLVNLITMLTFVSNFCGILFPTFVAFCFQLLRYFVSNFCGKFIKGRQTKYQLRQTKKQIPCIKTIIFLNGAGYKNQTCTGVPMAS